MACYSCQKIVIESLAIGDKVWSAKWYDLSHIEEGKSYKQALIFIVMRSQRPCTLTICGLSVMTIEIFTLV